MLVPDAAFKVKPDRTASLPLIHPHTHPVKGIGAQNTTFWQNALGSFTQTRQHSQPQTGPGRGRVRVRARDWRVWRGRRRRPNRETAAPGAWTQNGRFFSRAAAKLFKSFSLWEICTTLFLFDSFTMPNEKCRVSAKRKCCRNEATHESWLVIY